ncbi:K(+)-transporting ATPase subunit F [Crenobacter sp. SG2303]|uniref:K(+)-transporting ATPase subunit F n=1 Tax=Crenobacter oryzisoli TaxID=3056844 RepID=A0ABT7XTG6_9NEIS|nr:MULTISPECIES: K(+)-transporting ATPase subunit F [unclassified Crenobacter]MDN0077084.1 K(+)-transporting ATPase subunit F [Crenobacter sp. SG2303]MDN0084696.1 K(+)-transporting ATPase subunit F [Crenobacter sp. SG2305]
MTAWYIFGGLLSVALAVYLVIALVNAEDIG